ncbi:MAG TPA: hypothetical protein VEK39_14235 [Solirubrobacterales bacterium]|nr:hypothetical protein [Solirubrobacterales bacterium]
MPTPKLTHAGVVLATAAAIVGGAVAAPASSSRAQTLTYTGKFNDLANARAFLEVKFRSGEPQRGSFSARHVLVACDTGFERRNFRAIRVHFHSNRSFDATRYTNPAPGQERYYRVEGELRRHGRAAGELTFFSNSAASGEPDCSFNTGRLFWKGRRDR